MPFVWRFVAFVAIFCMCFGSFFLLAQANSFLLADPQPQPPSPPWGTALGDFVAPDTLFPVGSRSAVSVVVNSFPNAELWGSGLLSAGSCDVCVSDATSVWCPKSNYGVCYHNSSECDALCAAPCVHHATSSDSKSKPDSFSDSNKLDAFVGSTSGSSAPRPPPQPRCVNSLATNKWWGGLVLDQGSSLDEALSAFPLPYAIRAPSSGLFFNLPDVGFEQQVDTNGHSIPTVLQSFAMSAGFSVLNATPLVNRTVSAFDDLTVTLDWVNGSTATGSVVMRSIVARGDPFVTMHYLEPSFVAIHSALELGSVDLATAAGVTELATSFQLLFPSASNGGELWLLTASSPISFAWTPSYDDRVPASTTRRMVSTAPFTGYVRLARVFDQSQYGTLLKASTCVVVSGQVLVALGTTRDNSSVVNATLQYGVVDTSVGVSSKASKTSKQSQGGDGGDGVGVSSGSGSEATPNPPTPNPPTPQPPTPNPPTPAPGASHTPSPPSGACVPLLLTLPHQRRVLDPLLAAVASDAVFVVPSIRGAMRGLHSSSMALVVPYRSDILWDAPSDLVAELVPAVASALLVDAQWDGPFLRNDTLTYGKQIASVARLALIADQILRRTDVAPNASNTSNTSNTSNSDSGLRDSNNTNGTNGTNNTNNTNKTNNTNGTHASNATNTSTNAINVTALRLAKDAALATLEREVNTFFGPASTIFRYDPVWGGVVPSSGLASDTADSGSGWYNAHHGEYGYFLYSFAVLAQLGSNNTTISNTTQQFTAAALALARDIANPSADDPYFPTLRYFDWFEGHSYSTGLFPHESVKSQESSSQAVHAWYAVRLLGTALNLPAVSLVGTALMALETLSADAYWHLHATNAMDGADSQLGQGRGTGDIYPAAFQTGKGVSGIVWSNKVAQTSSLGTNPEFLQGMQMLPFTPISESVLDFCWMTYNNQFLSSILSSMDGPQQPAREPEWGPLQDAWRSVLLMGQAVVQPKDAWIASQRLADSVVNGSTRTNLLWWIATRPAWTSSSELLAACTPAASSDDTAFVTGWTAGVLAFSFAVALSVEVRRVWRVRQLQMGLGIPRGGGSPDRVGGYGPEEWSNRRSDARRPVSPHLSLSDQIRHIADEIGVVQQRTTSVLGGRSGR